jgi:hypothetical protein
MSPSSAFRHLVSQSGTGLGPLIPVPDWLRYRHSCSFRYQTDWMPDNPAFKKHFTKVYAVNLFISLETNIVRLRKNPWFVRRQICKFTRRNSGKLEWGNPWVLFDAQKGQSRTILRKTHPHTLYFSNYGKIIINIINIVTSENLSLRLYEFQNKNFNFDITKALVQFFSRGVTFQNYGANKYFSWKPCRSLGALSVP